MDRHCAAAPQFSSRIRAVVARVSDVSGLASPSGTPAMETSRDGRVIRQLPARRACGRSDLPYDAELQSSSNNKVSKGCACASSPSLSSGSFLTALRRVCVVV